MTKNVNIIDYINSGGIFILVTDTLFGLACVFDSPKVFDLFVLKGRDYNKPIALAFADLKTVYEYAIVKNPDFRSLIQKFLPGPFTFILKSNDKLKLYENAQYIIKNSNIGVRIPDNQSCISLINLIKKPLALTSANLSGYNGIVDIDYILKTFSDLPIYNFQDIAKMSNIPSTIIDLSDDKNQTKIR